MAHGFGYDAFGVRPAGNVPDGNMDVTATVPDLPGDLPGRFH